MSKRTRIISHIFRPDVWFVMPPACNVVFPEECSSVGYNRRMMLETTRLQLQTFSELLKEEGGAVGEQLLQNYYFAPALDETKFKTLSSDINIRRDKDKKVIAATQAGTANEVINALHYEHEKYTGIIPKIEQISDIAFYAAAQRQIQATSAPGAGNLSNNTATPDSAVDIYAQRAATFNLLRYRYAGRAASISARFMPRLVAGFPALVVNRPKEADTDDPIHFVGLISSVSHTVGQSGGTTNFELSYARQHNVMDDEDSFLRGLKGLTVTKTPTTQLYFGSQAQGVAYLNTLNRQLKRVFQARIDKGEDYDSATQIYTLVCSGAVDAAKTEAEEVGLTLTALDKGPAGNPIKGVSGVWFGSTEPTTLGQLVTLVGGNKDLGLSALDLMGVAPTTTDYVAELVALGPADLDISDRVPVVLSLSVVEGLAQRVSFEEAITPPWFSASYGNTKISNDIYEPALGCAALGNRVGDTSSAQAAAEKMVAQYSQSPSVRAVQGDPKFVYDYTHREIPTLSQVLAFHANAFDPAPDGTSAPLFGLDAKAGGVVEKSTTVLKNGFKDTPLDLTGAGYLDPRQERKKRVSFYVTQLNSRSAFRG